MKFNSTYNNEILKIRKINDISKKNIDDNPISFWFSKELFNNKIYDNLTIILNTIGCFWAKSGGCSMCGYINDSSNNKLSSLNIINQIKKVLNNIDKKYNQINLKIFTSGSFFDTREIPLDARNKILEILNIDDRINKLSIETRPEFISEKLVQDIKKIYQKKLEFSYGLETISDTIRIESINKGFLFLDFLNACNIAKKYNIYNKVYLLLKPPFLSEKESIKDIINSINTIHNIVDIISINPCNIQKNTFVEKLWKNKEYDNPWLWSLITILIECKKKYPNLIIISEPTGIGSKRGISNRCQCDLLISKKLKEYSLSQDINILEKLNCKCKYKWEKYLLLNERTFGSILINNKFNVI